MLVVEGEEQEQKQSATLTDFCHMGSSISSIEHLALCFHYTEHCNVISWLRVMLLKASQKAVTEHITKMLVKRGFRCFP